MKIPTGRIEFKGLAWDGFCFYFTTEQDGQIDFSTFRMEMSSIFTHNGGLKDWPFETQKEADRFISDIQPLIDSLIRQTKDGSVQREGSGSYFLFYVDPVTRGNHSIFLCPETKDVKINAQKMGEIASVLIPETQNL